MSEMHWVAEVDESEWEEVELVGEGKVKLEFG
jgi:hypothetical protein